METCTDLIVSDDIVCQLQRRKTNTELTLAQLLANENRYIIIGVKFGRGSMENGIYGQHKVKPLVLGAKAITFQSSLWGEMTSSLK